MAERNPKILFLIQLPPPVHGVSQMNQLVWEEALNATGIEKHLLQIDSSDDIRELRRFNPKKIMRFIGFTHRLRSELSRLDPAVVYFSFMPAGWGFWRDLWLARIIRRRGIHVVFHLHNRGIRRQSANPLRKWCYRYIFEDAGIIHLSEKLLEEEVLPLRLKRSRLAAIPNGIRPIPPGELQPRGTGTLSETEKQPPGTGTLSETEKQTGRKATSPVGNTPLLRVLFLSNLFPAKGIYDLLDICRILRQEGAPVRCRVAGAFMRRSHEAQFHLRRRTYDLEQMVEVVGEVWGPAKWAEYRQADLFVFPSRFRQECLPLVLLEAMQAGLPIVSFALGAIPDLIRNGEEGLLIEPGNKQAFAGAMLDLVRDEEIRKRLGNNAQRRFLSAFTATHFMDRFNGFLRAELMRSGDPSQPSPATPRS